MLLLLLLFLILNVCNAVDAHDDDGLDGDKKYLCTLQPALALFIIDGDNYRLNNIIKSKYIWRIIKWFGIYDKII